MRLHIHRVAAGVTTLGYGRRAAVWVQGCDLGCPGCCTPQSWDPSGGVHLTVAGILDWIGQQGGAVDGLTVSGGEPAMQPGAVCALIDGFRARFSGGDVLLYSGLGFRRLSSRHPELVATADVVCAGPYVRSLPQLPLRGSSNQSLHLLTPLGRARYRDADDWPIASQFRVRNGGIVTVGIPDRSALDHIAANLSSDPSLADPVIDDGLPRLGESKEKEPIDGTPL